MGCCGSKAEGEAKDTYGPHQDRRVYASHRCGNAGVQVGISVAGWLSSLPLDKLSIVAFHEGYIFAAMFDVHGRREAAEYCSSRLQQVLSGQLASSQGDIACALTHTLRQLDSEFLACQTYTEQVRATSGASGSVVYLSTSTQMLHVASVGGSNIIMGELLHGLAKQVAEATFLMPHAEKPCLIGMGRLRHPHLAEVHGSMSSPGADTSHGIGFNKELAVSIVAKQLLPVHESIIIGGPGLWSLAAPAATALRAHFYLRANAADQYGGADVAVPHTADHLVRFAVQQESSRLPRPPGMDMAALVLTLKWPANSINQAFADNSLLERLRRSPEREAAPLGQAQRHWRLIRTLCIEYTRAHRRMVQHKWQRTVQLALEHGTRQARKLEEELWKTQGLVVQISPSMKMRDQRGKEVKLRPRNLECTAYA